MHKFFKTVLVSALLIIPTIISISAQVNNVETSEISGTVIKVEDYYLTIKDNNDEIKQIEVPGNIRVTRDGQDSRREDIKIDDEVTILTTSDNDLIEVQVTSSTVKDISENLIPIILVTLLVLGLLYWLYRKSNKGQIITATENIKETD